MFLSYLQAIGFYTGPTPSSRKCCKNLICSASPAVICVKHKGKVFASLQAIAARTIRDYPLRAFLFEKGLDSDDSGSSGWTFREGTVDANAVLNEILPSTKERKFLRPSPEQRGVNMSRRPATSWTDDLDPTPTLRLSVGFEGSHLLRSSGTLARTHH